MTTSTVVAELEARSERLETPCGDGRMVWRRWGAGPPLVLLHGGSGSWTHWIRNIDALSRHRSVLVPDMPGYGESDLPSGEPGFETIPPPIAEGIRMLVPGDQGFDLAGFSMGSHMSLYISEEMSARVRRLVLVSGHLMGPLVAMPNQILERWRDIADPAERAEVLRRNLGVLMFSRLDRIDDLAVHLYERDLSRARVRPQRFINKRDHSLVGRLACPIAAISGEHDPLATPSVPEQGKEFLAARPDGRFHMVRDAGHWVAYEAPTAFNDALLELIA